MAYLLSGMVFGLSSGIAPGPILALSIGETVRHGLNAGLRVACVPLFTDTPTILLSWLVLAQLDHLDQALGAISFVGGIFLLWLGYESIAVRPIDDPAPEARPRSLRKGLTANIFNPSPYLFWVTVGTPTLMEAWREAPVFGVGYLACFFACIVGSKALIALAVARFRDFMRSRFYLTLMRGLGLALWFFAFVFFRKALAFWS